MVRGDETYTGWCVRVNKSNRTRVRMLHARMSHLSGGLAIDLALLGRWRRGGRGRGAIIAPLHLLGRQVSVDAIVFTVPASSNPDLTPLATLRG